MYFAQSMLLGNNSSVISKTTLHIFTDTSLDPLESSELYDHLVNDLLGITIVLLRYANMEIIDKVMYVLYCTVKNAIKSNESEHLRTNNLN